MGENMAEEHAALRVMRSSLQTALSEWCNELHNSKTGYGINSAFMTGRMQYLSELVEGIEKLKKAGLSA